MLWHCRLAHMDVKDLEILQKFVTYALTMTEKCHCKRCIKWKLTWKPCALCTTSRATELLQLVYSDICGPLETATRGDPYMLLFIEDATGHIDEYILKYKSEALEKFKK